MMFSNDSFPWPWMFSIVPVVLQTFPTACFNPTIVIIPTPWCGRAAQPAGLSDDDDKADEHHDEERAAAAEQEQKQPALQLQGGKSQ
jgi:hypothetical protein